MTEALQGGSGWRRAVTHAQRVRAHVREIMTLLHLGLDADLLASVLVCDCEHVSAPAEQRRDMDQPSSVDSTVSQKPG